MTRGAIWQAGMTGVVAALAATLPHAAIAGKVPGRHAPKTTLSLDTDRFRTPGLTAFAPPLLDTARFTFTAPGRGASTARVDTVERAFRFTPSGQPGSRKALSVGVTSRVTAAPAADPARVATVESFSVAPAAYNVGLSVGWRGFTVGGGYTRYDAPVTALGPNHREAIDASFGYRGKNWKTALQVAAETGSPLLLSPLERRYSVDVGGAYAIGPRLSLSGGVRYKLAPVSPSILDADRPDGSVYLGTAFAF
jgi:hypothetical protein